MSPVLLKKRNHYLRTSIFSDKVKPVPTGSLFGNCSACVFRNIETYCKTLGPVCSYISPDDEDLYGTVYWETKYSGDAYGFVGGHPPVWGERFFERNSISRIQKIAGQMVRDALREQKQK